MQRAARLIAAVAGAAVPQVAVEDDDGAGRGEQENLARVGDRASAGTCDEPAAGGPDRSGLRGFAFSTIPLTPPHRRDPEASVGSAATSAERPEG